MIHHKRSSSSTSASSQPQLTESREADSRKQTPPITGDETGTKPQSTTQDDTKVLASKLSSTSIQDNQKPDEPVLTTQSKEADDDDDDRQQSNEVGVSTDDKTPPPSTHHRGDCLAGKHGGTLFYGMISGTFSLVDQYPFNEFD